MDGAVPLNAVLPPTLASDRSLERLGAARRADVSLAPAEAARRFEAVMLATLVAQMRESSQVKFFGESPGAQIFEGLLDQQLGDALSRGRGVGLAASVEASIARMQQAVSDERNAGAAAEGGAR